VIWPPAWTRTVGTPWDQDLVVTKTQVTAYDPADDPMVLEEVRDDYLKVTNGSVEDALIQSLIDSSLGMAQYHTDRTILPETWRLEVSSFPSNGRILLPLPPLIEVVSVEYADEAGDTQTLDAAEYNVKRVYGPKAQRSAITLLSGGVWPSTYASDDAVQVTFRCGYVDGSVSPEVIAVPALLQQARRMLVEDWYVHRGSTEAGAGLAVVPNEHTAIKLFQAFRDIGRAG